MATDSGGWVLLEVCGYLGVVAVASVRQPGRGLVFLVLSHRESQQVVRLIRRIHEDLPGATILLRHDTSACGLDRVITADMSYVIPVGDGSTIKWGDWSMVARVMEAVGWTIDNLGFEWITCLSGQDYPATHLRSLDIRLRDSEVDGYLSTWPVAAYPHWDDLAKETRYFFRWYEVPPGLFGREREWLFHRTCFAFRVVNRLAGRRLFAATRYPRDLPYRVGRRRLGTPFGPNRPCLVGGQWWTLRHRAAGALVREFRCNRKLNEYFEHTMIPDECYFHTILGAETGMRLEESLALVDWTRREQPHVYGAADFDEIVRSGKTFVRKVDASVDTEILDLLDAHAASLMHRDELMSPAS